MAQELKRFDIVGKYSDEETMYEFRHDGECYDADEVDAVLDEKDAEILELREKVKKYENLGSCMKGCPALRHNQRRVRTELYKAEQKDKEIAELKAQVHDYAQCLYVIQARAEKEARRHKYNRCLLRSVIAEMHATHFKNLFYGAGSEALADEYNKQITIHYKWQKRWLALAEKNKQIEELKKKLTEV